MQELKSLITLGLLVLCSVRVAMLHQTVSVPRAAILTSPLAGIVSFIIAPTVVVDNKSTKWGRKTIETK